MHDRSAPPWPHSAAILAGGRSTRMGSPKHALPLADGRPMIEHVADACTAITPSGIVVGPDDALPGWAHVHDLRMGQGPLGGIEALLASDHDTRYLVVPCDLPRITASLLRALTDANDAAPLVAMRRADRDEPESLPLRIDTSMLPVVRAALDAGLRSIRALLEASTPHIVPIDTALSGALHNVNTPADTAES